MIVQLFLNILFAAMKLVMGFVFAPLKLLSGLPDWLGDFMHYWSIGLFFIPKDVVDYSIVMYGSWYGIKMGIGIFNFVIRKIPGVA